MLKSIAELENVHEGKDIYVVAAGKSCDFIDPGFFSDKIAIGVNQVYRRFEYLNYIVKKDAPSEAEVSMPIPFVVSQFQYGGQGSTNLGDYYFSHNVNGNQSVNFNGLHPLGDRLVVSYSTITSAMHFAAFLGAKTIFLVGHDCRPIDGEASFAGYHDGVPHLWPSVEAYKQWLDKIEPQSISVKHYIKANYNCDVHSINPFVSLRFEGHELGQ